jgi:hypothetical protein
MESFAKYDVIHLTILVLFSAQSDSTDACQNAQRSLELNLAVYRHFNGETSCFPEGGHETFKHETSNIKKGGLHPLGYERFCQNHTNIVVY